MKLAGIAWRLALMLGLVAFLARPSLFAPFFAPLTRFGAPPIYDGTSLLSLTLSHLALTGAATLAASALALGLAILVTRPSGTEFLPFSRAIANAGQTFPPVAVLALTVPLLGFGGAPTFLALFLYGLLPVFENALAGLSNVAPSVAEAARGSGMTGPQRLRLVELPLAAPVILSGIRLSAIVSLGTATVGSTVGAKTLGEVVIAGLLSSNTAFVLQGGLIVAVLAILLNDAFQFAEARLRSKLG